MKVLFITSFLPNKNATQAGVNFTYNIIEILNKKLGFSVDLLCTINEEEKSSSQEDIKKLTNKRIFHYVNKKNKIKNIIKSPFKPFITSVRYDCRIIKELKRLSKENVKYDYIVLDYTQNISYIDIIKKLFTDARTILLEQDVSFLGIKRKVENTHGLSRLFNSLEYRRLKKYELSKIDLFDKVYTVNQKDALLLGERDNVGVLYPFINEWKVVAKKHETFNIMFWGAMNRIENEDAVLFFIDNIWPNINKENVKFYIIGSKPSKKILELANDNIIVTGFVDDPSEYFSIMDISVVPLRLGAGIKIKVLESMANGIPTITTTVGAEGIEVVDEEEIFITDDWNEFAIKINKLKEDKGLREKLSNNAYKKIKEKYSFESNKNILSEFVKIKGE
ncbi:hypothetical protein SDC9_52224 [bioreactor metagenome]|uniref:Glycosyltransferase subfamily 4-like N-terminal domain-containing protein n=1 Tax=bioreactor metagenome TaxID=1076179 RepID=A0A644WQG5_9ZZZZ